MSYRVELFDEHAVVREIHHCPDLKRVVWMVKQLLLAGLPLGWQVIIVVE